MSNYKFQISNLRLQKGFTLVELLVVIAIMGLLLAALSLDFASQRAKRNLKIAQNELVTNIKKIQSYTLSSRSVGTSQPVQYYLIKFDSNAPTQYVIQAMYDVESSPKLIDVETVRLPGGIKMQQVEVDRPAYPTSSNPVCSLLAFKTPFAKTFTTLDCNSNSWDQSTDDYQKILSFFANVPNYSASSDSNMIITLSASDGALSKTVTVYGINGIVTFN